VVNYGVDPPVCISTPLVEVVVWKGIGDSQDAVNVMQQTFTPKAIKNEVDATIWNEESKVVFDMMGYDRILNWIGSMNAKYIENEWTQVIDIISVGPIHIYFEHRKACQCRFACHQRTPTIPAARTRKKPRRRSRCHEL
jgi:hypothetical protein